MQLRCSYLFVLRGSAVKCHCHRQRIEAFWLQGDRSQQRRLILGRAKVVKMQRSYEVLYLLLPFPGQTPEAQGSSGYKATRER